MKKTVILAVLLFSAVAFAENGARYLVITTDALYPSILPLAQWKQATGVSARVVTLSQIGSDTASIKNYIRNAWNTWPVRPEYVLIVGSGSTVPARYYYVQHGWSYYSDNIYGDMTGDIRAEIPVGRFPARSTAQLDLMVAKTLMYERTPDLTDSLWMRRMTTIVREADGGDPDDSIYWNNVRNAARQAGAAGFVSCDSFAYSRGHTAGNVVNSVTNGTGLVLYRGNAGGNWYQPFDVNPALTNNGKKLPIIASITCETMTLAPNESMVGDAWVKAGTLTNFRGAVAFFGNTHSASDVARPRGAVARGFFDGLFAENTYKLGKVVLRAKQQLYQEFPTYTGDYRGFNLLGDPDLSIWTATPKALTVSHPADIRPGPQILHVIVGVNSTPVESALVCASMATDTTLYAYGLTNADGEIDLSISPADTGVVRLVVTGRNLYPYDTVIPVTLTAVAEPTMPRRTGTAGLTATPALFSNTTTIRFSTPSSDPKSLPYSLTIYDAAGRSVRTLHSQPAISNLQPATVLSWDGRDETGEPVNAGIYLCVLEDPQGLTLSAARLIKIQ